ncbi:hypothetical protein [Pedobacter steynii]|uniref:Uncharacterized protein n=1 Tax=Pedobacter steynii TaxID=430522 RepID=A0A1D7QBH8_9SPHI|nr:hypothetical protein [Pedobacter steynii]AOM75924.1 hypothetical protein BFS30_01300 [Pedobacter steynii]
MKRLFKALYYWIFACFFQLKFNSIASRLQQRVPVYLVDIDNTLADTWPSLRDRVYLRDRDRYRSLSVFIGMRKLIAEQLKKAKVIFISARSYRCYKATAEWLQSCGFEGAELILVTKAEDKMYYIKTLVLKGLELVYIDDLSYNHEHGELKLYHELIRELKDLPLTYLGIKEIESINSNYEINHQDTQKTFQDFSNYSQY